MFCYEEKLKKNTFLLWKNNTMFASELKKTVEKFVGEKLSINYSKKQKNEQYIVLDSAIKCYHMLPSAIKCYQVLPSAIKCCALKKN